MAKFGSFHRFGTLDHGKIPAFAGICNFCRSLFAAPENVFAFIFSLLLFISL
jgi:hypothetical protein